MSSSLHILEEKSSEAMSRHEVLAKSVDLGGSLRRDVVKRLADGQMFWEQFALTVKSLTTTPNTADKVVAAFKDTNGKMTSKMNLEQIDSACFEALQALVEKQKERHKRQNA